MTVLEPDATIEIPPELAHHPRYRVWGQLGAGGMGVVYKAEHVLMGRTVAVKVMAKRFTANPTAVERFRREVRAAAKLAHPNIVTAYDADEADGSHFLVMEYVEGVSLDRVVNRRGPLPVATACQVVRMVALGLQHAHSKGMVHRDIKPQNVMVNRKAQVKILDFGLARLATDGDLPAGDGGSQHPGVTGTNTVVGTPDYVSPEQAKAVAVDHRSDLYSLGCLFYFALAGRPPFADATTALAKVTAHVVDPPPALAAYRADLPPEVAAVVARLLAKNPADRFASAADVAAARLPFAKNTHTTPALTTTPAPRVELVPAADFGFTDEPSAETLAVTQPSQRMLAARRSPRWKYFAGLAALVTGTLFFLLVLIGLLTPPKRDAGPPAAVAPPAKPATVPPTAPPAVRVLFVLPNRGLYLDDYEPVRAKLLELGAKVTTAAVRRGRCLTTGESRTVVMADLALADVRPDDYDAVLFTGYETWELLGAGQPQLERIVRPMADAKKTIGAICVGQRVLVGLQLLSGKQAALPDYESETFQQRGRGVTWIQWRRVVTDGNIVTASASQDAAAFAEAVIAAAKSGERGASAP